MATDSDFTSFLKEIYPDDKIPDLAPTRRPGLDMLKKNTKFGGNSKRRVMATNNGKAASHTDTTAFAATNTQTTYKQFDLTAANDYRNVYIPMKDFLSAKSSGKLSSFGDLLMREVDSAKQQMLNRVARQLFSTGLGSIGQISAVSGADLTLSRARDHQHFYVGQVLQADTTDGSSGTVHAGTVTVSSVNRQTGVVTLSTHLTGGIASGAANDYLFEQGDFGGGMYGLGSWLGAATASESFYGLDRTTADYLQGVRYTVTGNKVDGLIDAVDALVDQGDSIPSVIFVNPVVFAEISKDLTSTVYHDPNGKGSIGFNSKILHTNLGDVNIVADRWVPSDEGYGINLDKIELCSIGELVQRQTMYSPIAASGDAFQIRLASYPVLDVHAPNAHLKITFS